LDNRLQVGICTIKGKRPDEDYKEEVNGPNFEVSRIEHILPICAISKRLRYEKQIKALHLFCSLLLEILHRRVEIEKQDFRKKKGKVNPGLVCLHL
jgi:hypothetical protein